MEDNFGRGYGSPGEEKEQDGEERGDGEDIKCVSELKNKNEL